MMKVKLGCRRRHSIHSQQHLGLHAKYFRSFTSARLLLLHRWPEIRSLSLSKTSASVDQTHDATQIAGRMATCDSVLCGPSNSSSDLLLDFKRKLQKRACLNCTIFVRLLSTCVAPNEILLGKQVHALITKFGFSSNRFTGSTLVDLYSKRGLTTQARQVFDEIPTKDLVLWNVMLSCYAQNGLGEEAFGTFKLMRVQGFDGDGFTFSSLLSSCSSLHCSKLGRQTHGLVIRLSFDADVVVGSAMIDMYAKCGDTDDARRAFDLMRDRNIFSWNSIIVGYGMQGEGEEAMKLLHKMLQEGIRPDELTLSSVLSSCTTSGAASEAIQVQSYVVKNGFQEFVSIGNALISAYAKNGDIHNSVRSFSLISNPDLVTWSSMISSYAFHGFAKEAMDTFQRMLNEGVKPDGIALLGIISACSHAGSVEDGLHYFASMNKEYQIKPSVEHYACLVDLLGRAGRLAEAYDVLINMTCEPSADVLGAFMGACKVYGNTQLAKWAADKLFRLEEDESANYMLMSNIYAALGCWDDVARIRKMTRNTCGNKVPGFSWINVRGVLHRFVSNDEAHPQAEEIRVVLKLLIELTREEEEYFV